MQQVKSQEMSLPLGRLARRHILYVLLFLQVCINCINHSRDSHLWFCDAASPMIVVRGAYALWTKQGMAVY